MPDSSQKTTPDLPLFRQIVEHIRSQINDGRLNAHSALPSERALAEDHGVSRMTARRALEAIEAEGLAYSEERRGRFVSPRRLTYNVNYMSNFVADAKQQNIDVEVELIESKEVTADTRLAELLTIVEGASIIERTRLFHSNDHTIFFETEFIAPDLCPDLRKHGSDELLTERYGTLGHTADIVVRMGSIKPTDAARLNVTPWQVGIEQEQIVKDRSGKAFCFVRQIWRGELVQFSTQAIENRES